MVWRLWGKSRWIGERRSRRREGRGGIAWENNFLGKGDEIQCSLEIEGEGRVQNWTSRARLCGNRRYRKIRLAPRNPPTLLTQKLPSDLLATFKKRLCDLQGEGSPKSDSNDEPGSRQDIVRTAEGFSKEQI